MYRKYETSLKWVSFVGFLRQPARYPTHLPSSRATKKLSRCFAIYRPSDISRKDCFSSWLQKSRLALDSKKCRLSRQDDWRNRRFRLLSVFRSLCPSSATEGAASLRESPRQVRA